MVVAGISEVKSNMHNNEDSIVHDHIVYTSAEARDCSEQNTWGDWFLPFAKQLISLTALGRAHMQACPATERH